MSQTYELVEVDYVKSLNYQIKIVSISKAYDLPLNYHPYTLCEKIEELKKIVEEFKPDIIHAHYLFMIETITQINKNKIPFTIRTHSYDLHTCFYDKIKKYSKSINHPLCLGILCFPYQVNILKNLV